MLKVEFEGTDAAGKTTGLKYFVEKAKERSMSVVETKEVGNPHIESSVKMRQLVLDPANSLSGEAMELIFSAMRVESDLWLKELAKSSTAPDLVASDRGFFSHLAYGLHNTSQEFVTGLFENLIGKITSLPNIVIYFNVDTAVAKQRMIGRGQAMDTIELKGTDFQEKVRNSFEHYFDKYSDKVNVFNVDANQDLNGVREQLDIILDFIECSIVRK